MVKTSRKVFKACRACRQKRARCNGETPCQRCASMSISCVYDQRPGETKDKLRGERTQLEAHDTAATIIIEALATREGDDEALIALWRRDPIEQIAANLLQRSAVKTRQQDDEAGDDDGDISMSGGASVERPSAPQSTQEVDFATNTILSPQQATGQDTSVSDRRKATKSLTSGCGTGVLRPSSQSQFMSADTSPQSAWSPAFSRSERSAYETPNSISQSPSGGPNNTQAKPPSSTERPPGEQGKEAGLMMMPYELTRSLIETFFGKQHSPFPMVRPDLFFNDFMTGKKKYCSSALVRILCCLGCRVTGGYDATLSYYAGIADRLFREAVQVMKSSEGSVCNIPNAQALGLMSLHQLAVGENEHARELADEGVRRLDLMHRQGSDDEAVKLLQSVQATALVKAITLARMVRLSVGQVLCPRPATQQDGPPMAIFRQTLATTNAHVEQLLSFPDFQVGHQGEDLTQLPSGVFQLTDWIYNFVSRSQVTVGNVLPQQLQDTYRACLSWYSSMLERADEETRPEPFVHLYYHFCLLTLFRSYRHVKSEAVSPAEVCLESADAILTLTKTCRHLESSQLLCFVPLFTQAAAHVELDSLCSSEEVVDGGVEKWVDGRARARARGGSHVSATSTGSSLSEMSGDEETARRSLTDRALEQLAELSTVYLSARKAASVLRGIRRGVSG